MLRNAVLTRDVSALRSACVRSRSVAVGKLRVFTERFQQVEKFRHVPSRIRVANLGSNHARFGFDYAAVPFPCFNFALGPQYLRQDFAILKAYSTHLARRCCVLIVLPPAIFCDDGSAFEDAKYYGVLPPAHIRDHSRFRRLTEFELPFRWFRLVSALCPQRLIRSEPASLTQEQVEILANHRVQGWVRQFGLSDMTSGVLPAVVQERMSKAVSVLCSMIDYCLAHDFRPVLLVPPVSGVLRRRLGEDYLRAALYDNMAKANSRSVCVLDYLNDKVFQGHSLYRNADFLTQVGARRFTEQVLNDLSKIGAIPEATASSLT